MPPANLLSHLGAPAPASPRLLNRPHILFRSILFGILAMPLMLYGLALHRRPLTQNQAPQSLFQGITYERHFLQTPRPQLIHRLSLDLTAPGLIPWVTPPISQTAPHLAPPEDLTDWERRETIAQKATTALATHQLQLVINANFFFPFVEDAPWNTSPAAGEPTSLVGTAIAQGKVVSPSQPNWSALCFLNPNSPTAQRAVISPSGQCPPETQEAVAGNLLLMDQGQPGNLQDENLTKPYPMVIAALDETGQQLQLILIDGKQPFYSEGITLPEAIALLQSWGIYNAIRLDGGGSTSLAIENAQGNPQLLNAVIQAKVPGQERPVANHLGFYAQPMPAPSSLE